ncbi:uncharacterized protein LOC135810434 [Sycon ciliatum]|uniref:uncharacterized protein LOC135810434 n=1 Tax=Sycon ciliatum TaxID=27933 RepID=UPI0031F5FC3E
MDIYFFQQKKRQRIKPVRKTIDDLKASRRERPESAAGTRFVLHGKADRGRQGLSEHLAPGEFQSPQVSPRDPLAATANQEHASPRIPKVFEQLRAGKHNLSVRFPPIEVTQDNRKKLLKVPGRGSIQADEEEDEEEDPQKVAFQEAQFAAPNVLAQLTRILNGEQVEEFVVPVELSRSLGLRYEQLVYAGGEKGQDVHLRYREWQTEAYKDMYLQRKQRLEEEAAEAERMQQDGGGGGGRSVAGTAEISPRRRSSMKHYGSMNGFNDTASVITSATTVTNDSRRMQKRSLDRSRESVISTATLVDTSGGSDMEQGGAFGSGGDSGPMIMRYHRESSSPVHDVPMPVMPHQASPLTRLERQTRSRVPARAFTVNFSLVSPRAMEEGWITDHTKPFDPERETMIIWLREHMKQTKAQRSLRCKSRGADKPLEIRHYGDSSRQERARLAALRRRQRKRSDGSKPYKSDGEDEFGKFTTKLSDGSCTAYYPSGRVAVCTCLFGPGNQIQYTYVFDDDEKGSMLGMFTPAGVNCCYDRGGMIRLLTNAEGGHLATERGVIIRQWAWPEDGGRLLPAPSYQLNEFLSWHSTSSVTATLHFYCQHELVKFNVGMATEENRKHILPEMTGKLQMASSMPYSSHAASLASDGEVEDRLGRKRLKAKRKISRAGSQLEEIHVASVYRQALSRMDEEDTADQSPDLGSIQKKIKSLVNQWMDHLRIASGMRPMSAPSSRSSTASSTSTLSLVSRSSHSAGTGMGSRASTSAALPYASGIGARQRSVTSRHSGTSTGAERPSLARTPSRQSQHHHVRHSTYPVLTVDALSERTPASDYMAAKQRVTGTPAIVSTPPPDTHLPAESLAQSRTVTPPPTTLHMQQQQQQLPPSLHSGRGKTIVCCPVALRIQLTKRQPVQPPCRCDQRHMPLVTDVEFDRFIQIHAPTKQLLIVNVTSTSESRTTLFDAMLEELYNQATKTRRTACQQVSHQAYRIVRYALCSAIQDTTRTIPLLQQRHNVVPGVCLMYADGKLVFAGNRFNGYGTSKRDFTKQVQQTLIDLRRDSFIPMDYKLETRTPSPILLSPQAVKASPRLQPPSPEHVNMLGRFSSLNVAAAGMASQTGSIVDQSITMSDLTLSPSAWDASQLKLAGVK